jgi:3-oxoadipate enol-lactonase
MGGFDGQHRSGGPVLSVASPPRPLDPSAGLPEGRHVDLPGRGRTFVRQLDGPPNAPVVVLLHGWTATSDLNWFACYAPLGQHFRVVAMDHRGHGRGLRTDAPFRLEDCADDVAALADELGLRRCIPVGYSMGGAVAQLLWRRHRRLVEGMVLCATSSTFSGTMRERVLSGMAVGTGVLAEAVPLERVASASLSAWHHWRRRRGRPWWGYEDVARHDWNEIVAAGRALLRYDARPWIGAVDVPSAVVVTAADDVVPTSRQLAMAERIGRVSRFLVDGGHTVCTTAPARFVPALLQACRDVADRVTTPPVEAAA